MKRVIFFSLLFVHSVYPLFRLEHTPLTAAISASDIKEVARLIDQGVSLEEPLKINDSGVLKNADSPLCASIDFDHKRYEIARLLINSGARLDSTNLAGQTPLMLAVCFAHVGLAQLIIEMADRAELLKEILTIQDKNGYTVFDIFVQKNRSGENAVTMKFVQPLLVEAAQKVGLN